MGIWWIVGITVLTVLISILVFRLHAFLTLLLAGVLAAALTGTAALEQHAAVEVKKGNWTEKSADDFVDSNPVSRVTKAFGETAGKIGVLIALASVIGGLLSESGAAAAIVQRILSWTGEKRSPEALAISSFVIGIPVFFDTVFYLMVPLARSLRRKVGKNYVLYILAILAGGSLAHSLIPPTPGPLQVAEILEIDVGVVLIAGLVIASISSVISLFSARVINAFVDVPLREDEELDSQSAEDTSLTSDSGSSAKPTPGFFESLLPILIPVVLITIGSVLAYSTKPTKKPDAKEEPAAVASAPQDDMTQSDAAAEESTPGDSAEETFAGEAKDGTIVESEAAPGPSPIARAFLTLGDKNVAIAIGLAFAMALMRYVEKARRRTLVGRSLASAGNIILITAAGGAFGAMLRQAGIAGAVSDLVDAKAGLMLLPVAFAVTVAIRTLQGSATVAMVTAAGVLQGLAASETLPFHPVYLAMAIGAGSKPVSWMTDSAFWVITRMTGMTEAEGLKVISPMSTAMGVSALVVTMIVAWAYPAIAS